MEDALINVVTEIPELAALIWLVMYFLKHQRKQSNACHEVQDRATLAMAENTVVLRDLHAHVQNGDTDAPLH